MVDLYTRGPLSPALPYVKQITEVTTSHQNTLISYSIPEDRSFKQSLGYIEDSYLNFTELTSKYNHATEEHIVKTKDGYLLKIFRILTKCSNSANPFPVILMHGIFDSSDAWILSGPETGLGYILSNNCYDVWAANNRGNRYSRNHDRLDPNKDFRFWNYSFDDISNYDVTAIIDYVLNATNRSKIYYIGHSQGTTDFLVMTSTQPKYNKKIQLAILLAPVAIMKHITSLLKTVAQGTDIIKLVFDSIRLQELGAVDHLEHQVLEKFCQFVPELVCESILYLTTGYKQDTIAPKTLTIAFGHFPVGVSIKVLAHFGQLIVSQRFQRYDEGLVGNMKKYGSIQPPEYNVSQITCPIVLFCAKNDLISTIKDIDELTEKLPNVIEKYVVPDSTWSHNNHLWSNDAPKYVFEKILQYFRDFDKT